MTIAMLRTRRRRPTCRPGTGTHVRHLGGTYRDARGCVGIHVYVYLFVWVYARIFGEYSGGMEALGVNACLWKVGVAVLGDS